MEHIIQILSEIPIFQGLSREDLALIVPILSTHELPAESLVVKEGDIGDSMFIIKSGTVRVTKTEENGSEVLISHLYKGQYFGEFSLIDNLPRSANVVTEEATEIFTLNRGDFDRLLAANIVIKAAFHQNCLKETFSRFRNIISNFTFAQHDLREKREALDEINRDLSLAKKLQRYFINTDYLRTEHTADNGVRHSYIYKPSIAIGGDFLNVFQLRDSVVGMIIADFEGHGITAALATGVLKSALSIVLADLGEKPIELMSFLNDHFHKVIAQLYATCYYAVIHTEERRIVLAKAGHHHPLVWKARLNDFTPIECPGTGLGLMPNARFGVVEQDIEPGDKVLFFTDGIIEQMNGSHEMYSKKRMTEKVRELILAGETNTLDRLLDDLVAFSGTDQFEDDVTMILFEF